LIQRLEKLGKGKDRKGLIPRLLGIAFGNPLVVKILDVYTQRGLRSAASTGWRTGEVPEGTRNRSFHRLMEKQN
jgi:hypothetical protein